MAASLELALENAQATLLHIIFKELEYDKFHVFRDLLLIFCFLVVKIVTRDDLELPIWLNHRLCIDQ